MVRVTRADGESGPWSIDATRHAPSKAASSSVAGSPRHSLSSIAGNDFAPDRLIEGNASHEDALVGRGRDRRRPGIGLVGLAGGRALVRSGAHCATW